MAKDPRFNFYPDNWSGGTKLMNFEQKGAYMELLLLNFYCFSDGLPGFTEEEALKSLANAAACTELWNFLKQKFKTDGKHFWSERMQKEFYKAKKHSEKQTDRANKRWSKQPADAAALPVNGIGSGNGIGIELKRGAGEKLVQLPPEDPELLLQAADFQEQLCKYFGVKPIVTSKLYDSVSEFVSIICNRGQLLQAIGAFEKYKAYKARSQEQRHGPEKWIGTKAEFFQDGIWNTTDYESKLKQLNETSSRGNNQGTLTAASAVIEPGKGFGSMDEYRAKRGGHSKS